ncbi:hypothetical protein N8D56_18525 [Devosia sp. A8/3-2]|nr:hypothetical protein N8D56_18525 [Devosia sp. A8/3-2]
MRPETVALATRNQIGDLPRDAKGQRFGYLSGLLMIRLRRRRRRQSGPIIGAGFMAILGWWTRAMNS